MYTVLLVSAIQQSESAICMDVHTHTHTHTHTHKYHISPLFLRFFSHIGDYRILE